MGCCMIAKELHLDVETYSRADLKKVGAYAYFEEPSTDLWCAAYSFDDGEVALWQPGEECPAAIRTHIMTDGIITAWNAAFERLAWKFLLAPKYGWPQPDDTQFRCTMTQALGMNLPGKLEHAGPAIGAAQHKSKEGHNLMMQMCKPRKVLPDGTVTWWDDAEKRRRLGEYCMQDVRTEAAIGERVMSLRPMEEDLYWLDMKINDRGVFIDEKLCRAAAYVVEDALRELDDEMAELTHGQVRGVSNLAGLKSFARMHGVEVEALDREALADLLFRKDLHPDLKRALEIRQEGSKTSTSKVDAFIRRRNSDGRMRGNLQFYGASATGRWAARGAQLQNLTRPVIIGGKEEGKKKLEAQIQTAIRCVLDGNTGLLKKTYGRPLTVIADLVRSMICAGPGHKLRSADFRNIEGRVVAWLAGQEDKLDAFRAFDEGKGPDAYLVAASGIYNVGLNEAEQHRQIGKVAELSLGFQGGAMAFARMSKTYGVRIGELYDGIWPKATEEIKAQAEDNWKLFGEATKMDPQPWFAAEVVKLAWRAKNWRIVAYWKEIEEAAIRAVADKNTVTAAGRIRFRCAGSFLFCLLPSGRGLSYPYPKLVTGETPWGGKATQLTYKSSSDPDNPTWQTRKFYGGLGVENVTQAVARDIMAEAMLRVERAGYRTVLTVHDEIVDESPIGFGSLEDYISLMVQPPTWAKGLPITAGGWEGDRYRKD